MNPFSIKDPPYGREYPEIKSHPDTAGQASTLKLPVVLESTALGQWVTPAGAFKIAPASAESESNIFDSLAQRAHDMKHHKGANNESADHSRPELKMVEFSVQLPEAKTVQLAADFTNWDESPIDMIRFADDYWSTTVPLPAGIYTYRFLVDGEWYDDPRSIRRSDNSFGEAKAVIQIK